MHSEGLLFGTFHLFIFDNSSFLNSPTVASLEPQIHSVTKSLTFLLTILYISKIPYPLLTNFEILITEFMPINLIYVQKLLNRSFLGQLISKIL